VQPGQRVKMPGLEIAVLSPSEARAALDGGADSVEFLRDLAAGGLTPPLDDLPAVRAVSPDLMLHIMIRPHARNFVYSPAEMVMVLGAVAAAKAAGADGVVFGAHTAEGDLHIGQIAQVAAAAAPLTVTVHRALDSCRDPEGALRALVGVVGRIHTAGTAPDAWAGRESVRRWRETYRAEFRFVSSGGLTLERLPAFVASVGVDEYHFGAAARTNGLVDGARVRLLRQALA
jgi:copper homeostasis protein